MFIQMHCSQIPPRDPEQKRQHPRFPLQYPVRLTFSDQGLQHELETLSRNVSLGGLLLETTSPVPESCTVEFALIIQSARSKRPIRLEGSGKVVRVEQHPSGNQFGVAVKCTRPIERILSVAQSATNSIN